MPELTAQVARAVAARGPYPLAMRVRDELGELFGDAEFAEAFGSRGRPGWSPGQLALVTVLQFTENLTDRAAAHRVLYGMDLKYALGLELDDPGFDASVLSEFRTRLVEHGIEEKAFDLLLTALKGRGLVKAGGKQRRLHPRAGGGTRSEQAGAGRGDAAGRAGGVGLLGPGLADPGGARSGMGRPLQTADSLLASAGLYEQA
ncbi:transposase [Streptomyces sp. NBC_01450]|uniref:transposase n=1 Tax=Streptomyces sp. NBC_01450 TaxID=2903871 RepID=UPI002E35736C|nr:transposase [Streptomyces sp. NBC_01450]